MLNSYLIKYLIELAKNPDKELLHVKPISELQK